jgi:UDP-4-amino-4,6-dideoxy-N-acetyl-beta-L-altrosamine N-acetyltransferase
MFLEHYDIRLSRLQKNDLELLREWRNSPLIRQTMEFREFISSEMQLEWFNSINNENNIYLIISHENKEVGLLNAKNINWDEKSFESGIFFWDTNYYNTFIPALVSLIATNFCFKILNYNVLYAHTLKTNKHAIKYNLSLGYELTEGQEDKENQMYFLTLEKFRKIARKFRRLIDLFSSANKESFVVIEAHDYEHNYGSFFEEKLIAAGLKPNKTQRGTEFVLPALA